MKRREIISFILAIALSLSLFTGAAPSSFADANTITEETEETVEHVEAAETVETVDSADMAAKVEAIEAIEAVDLVDSVEKIDQAAAENTGETVNTPSASDVSRGTYGLDQLVLYVDFEDENKSVTHVLDQSGGGNDGELVGNPTFVEGVSGKAVFIDNGAKSGLDATAGTQYINFGQPDDLKFGSDDFSVSFWIKTTGGGKTNAAVLSNKNYASGSNVGFAFGILGGQSNGVDKNNALNFSALKGSRVDIDGANARDDKWHQLSATFDRSGDMVYYLDGAEVGRKSISHFQGTMFADSDVSPNVEESGEIGLGTSSDNKQNNPANGETALTDGLRSIIDTGFDFVLGSGGNKTNAAQNVAIDELRVYKNVLAPATVKTLYTDIAGEILEPSVIEKDLVLYTSFDEATVTGATIADQSSKANDGTIVGNLEFAAAVKGNGVKIENPTGVAGANVTATNYINYGSKSDLQFGANSFSISYWMKTQDHGMGNGVILSNKDYNSGNNQGYAIGNFNNVSQIDNRFNFSTTGNSRVEVAGVSTNDDSWHHVVAVFNRGTDLVVYSDGLAVGKDTRMATHTGSINTAYPFIVGADGTLKYGMAGVILDELRIYEAAISPETIGQIYAFDGILLKIEEMLEVVSNTTPSEVHSAEEIGAMAQRLETAKVDARTLSPEDCVLLLAELEGEFNNFIIGGTPIMSFYAVSDVHISNTAGYQASRTAFEKGLADMKSLNLGATAMINAGDNTPNGSRAEQNAFWNIFNAGNPVPNDGVIVALGNHDVRDRTSWSNDPTAETPFWNTAYGYYMTDNAAYMPVGNDKVYFEKWIDGYHFTVLNSEKGLKDSIFMNPEQVSWLDTTLKENTKADQPNFLIVHQPLFDSHWRGNVLNGFGSNDAEVKEILRKYPQTIVLSGHIHNGFGIAEIVDRDYGTLVEIPSYNDSENGNTSEGIGYYVAVYADRVVFRARNFAESKWLPEFDQVVKTASLPIAYGKAVEASKKTHTSESWARVQTIMDSAEATLLDLKYTQNMAWNEAAPPPTQFFTPQLRANHESLAIDLETALEGLVEIEAKQSLPLIEGTYLQGGSDAAKVNSAYSNYVANLLKVKLSDGAQNYSRKTVLTFDISGADAINYNQATLQLAVDKTVEANPGPNFVSGEIKKIPSTWTASSVTWNSLPAGEVIGQFSATDITDNILKIDISEALFKAVGDGETKFSIEVSIPTPANDNKIEFYSANAAGDKGPAITLTSVSVADPQFVALRQTWVDHILGGTLDTSKPQVVQYVEGLNETANGHWNTMNKAAMTTRTNLWNDLDMSYLAGTSEAAKVRSGNISTTYYRIESISKAYFTEGTDLYMDAAVKEEIIKALDFMYQKYYNENKVTNPVFGNWWHWEIGSPISSLTTTMLFYDDLTPTQIKNYVAAVNRFTPVADKPSGNPGSPAMTGANLIDKATAVALAGVLTEDAVKMEHVKTAIKTVFVYVTSGDGFYADGSFIQHQALAFIGAYGVTLYGKLSTFLVVLKDSPYELSYDDDAQQLIYDMIFSGIEPLFYDGRFMDMVSGRDIVRMGNNDRSRGVLMVEALLPMRNSMPSPQERADFDSFMKTILLSDEDYIMNGMTNITALMTAIDILSDDTITPKAMGGINKQYGGMDKYVYSNNNYTLGLAMHSNRTYGHELINDEGKQTWNVADGATYIFTPDKDQFSDGYWATIDPTRIPGTTVEHTVHPKGAGDRVKNVHDWVGGTTLGGYSSTGMHYKALGTGGSRNGADVKKSWFVFGDEIVALGSGITSTTGARVETIIDNRKINLDGSNQVVIDGQTANVSTPTTYTNPSWIYVEGTASSGDGMGYYFPQDVKVEALKETRNGNWINQGTSSGAVTNSFATLWIDHGANPTNAGYSYVLVPTKTQAEVQALAESSDIMIIANTPDVHAASKPSMGITGVNFWKGGVGSIGGISTDKPASVTMERNGNIITVAVSDPTQKNNGTIQVTIAASSTGAITVPSNAAVIEAGTKIVFTVDTTALMGATTTVSFGFDPSAPTEVVEILPIEAIAVPLFTPFRDLPLPSEVIIVTNDGAQHEVAVSWKEEGYNRATSGAYTLKGTLTIPADIENSGNIEASVKVLVGEVSTAVIGDTYLQGGTDTNKPGSSWMGTSLVIKNDAGAQSYTRKSVIKFNIEDVPVNAETVFLELEGNGSMADDFTMLEIYHIENGWTPETLTFSTIPARVSATPTAVITRGDMTANLKQKIDITTAYEAAIAAGMTEISFELSIPTPAGNNGIYFHSSRSTTGQVPTVSWESSGQTIDGELNLEFLIHTAEELDRATFQPHIWADLDQAVTDAKQALANPAVTAAEMRLCEYALTTQLSSLRKIVVAK